MILVKYPHYDLKKSPEWTKNTRKKALMYSKGHLVLLSEYFSILGLNTEKRVVERLLKKVEGIIEDEKK